MTALGTVPRAGVQDSSSLHAFWAVFDEFEAQFVASTWVHVIRPTRDASEIILFDSDADTGDSLTWQYGFFDAGTGGSLRRPDHPTRPRTEFSVYFLPQWVSRIGSAEVRERYGVWTESWLDDVLDEEPIAESRPVPTVAEVLHETKRQAGLPVLDLARMIGLKRRRFYDLLDGAEPERERVPTIFAVGDAVAQVAKVVGDRRRTASALVAPVLESRSFYDIATTAEGPELIRRAGAQLAEMLAGGMSAGARPAPSVAPREDPERTSARFTNAVGAGDG